MMIAGKAAELEQALAAITGEPLVILICGHPDPDAIASALAHRRICEHADVPVTIASTRPPARPENRALIEQVGLEMVRIASAAELESFRYLSLVDACDPEPTLALPTGLELFSVVDHHRPPQRPQAAFVDLRVGIGATCSIYAEYFEAGLAPLRADDDADVALATALLFGIRTDTDDFELARAEDFRAAAYLEPLSDSALLARFGRRSMDPRAMDALRRALAQLRVVGDFGVATVGRVTAENRDAIAIAADFIVQREDIRTVIVYGVVGDRIDGSLRTCDPGVDPAGILDQAFGRDAAGRPYGGGRTGKGGFQLPLQMVAAAGPARTGDVDRYVRSRIARVVPGVLDHG